MGTKVAVLLARPEQENRLALRTSDLEEFEAFWGVCSQRRAEPLTPPGLGEMTISVPMGSFEISGKKLAITFRDSCELYAHPETGAPPIGSKDRRPHHLGDGADCRVIGWLDDQPKVPLQWRRFHKGDERTN